MEVEDMTEEQHAEYQVWAKKVHKLNDHINSLKKWNGYAESQQREYDHLLLEEDPRLKWEKEK